MMLGFQLRLAGKSIGSLKTNRPINFRLSFNA